MSSWSPWVLGLRNCSLLTSITVVIGLNHKESLKTLCDIITLDRLNLIKIDFSHFVFIALIVEMGNYQVWVFLAFQFVVFGFDMLCCVLLTMDTHLCVISQDLFRYKQQKLITKSLKQ